MPDAPPVLDIEGALSRALGDVAFLKMMFDEFQQLIPDIMAAICRSIDLGDMQQLARDAHQFKGAAANMGAVATASAALALEKAAKSGNAADCRQAVERIRITVDHFKERTDRIDWSSLGER